MAVKIGTEFLVNNVNQFGAQARADVAGTSDGNFVIVWESEKRTGDPDYLEFDIQGRMFGSSLPIKDEFQVNIITEDRQFSPTVTALAEGGFAAAYSSGEDNLLPGTTVTTRLLDASGVPTGDEFSPVYSYFHRNPQSASFSDGSYVVVWSEEYNGEGEIRAADGSLLSTFTFGFEGAVTPKNVVTLADDSFAVFWYGYKDEDDAANGGSQAFYGQIIGSGEPFEIGSAPGQNPQPSVARLSDGNFVVIWQDDRVGLDPETDPDGTNLIGRIFSPSGGIIGDPFVVNSTLAGDQFNADVAALSDGRFVVTWQDTTGEAGVPNAGSAIRAQIFGSDGSFIGGEFLVNTAATIDQGDPTVASLGDDRFVIAWTDGSGEGGDIVDGGIKAQLFAVDAPDDETIAGTSASERLDGGFGNDDISGREGADTVFAGAGNDLVKGDKGEDILYGGLNNDRLIGGWQNDKLYGEVGDDILYGDLTGQIGRGSRGANDTLHGGDGGDILYGDALIIAAGGRGGNDHLYGDRGDDFIYGDGQSGAGGGGRDRIDGGFGNDQLWGGGGDDRFVFNGLSGSDIIWDFGGNDVIDLRGTEAGDPTNEPLQIDFVGGNAELRFNGGFIKVVGVTSFDPGDILVT